MRKLAIVIVEHLYYDNGMTLLPLMDALTEPQRGCHVLLEAGAATEPLLHFVARLALESHVNILDAGGMRFDVHCVARLLLQQSTEVYSALERIRLVRAFNACQLTDALGLFEGDVLHGRQERYVLMEYYAAIKHLGTGGDQAHTETGTAPLARVIAAGGAGV